MKHDAIVVGGGMAGLTSAAYLAQAGYKVMLCEKQSEAGGLVNSFERNGYVFDGGIRATEDLGILFPMLKQLGIELEFKDNPVSIGIMDEMVDLKGIESIEDYKKMLTKFFPDSAENIGKIVSEIYKIAGYMDIQYGIENPVFKDIKNDRQYLKETLLPWLVKYIFTISKVNKLKMPVEDYLEALTPNQSLTDVISQHFFSKTPAYFAMSYITLYLDYKYPNGGTGMLPKALKNYIKESSGEVRCDTEITKINLNSKKLRDKAGNTYEYEYLIWAADMKKLYDISNVEDIAQKNVRKKAAAHKRLMENKKGGDSVYTLYAECDMPPEYFKKMHGAHVFYTPHTKGVDGIETVRIFNSFGGYTEVEEVIMNWLKKYYKYTTYEISIPALRDASLAPEGKTGLIISTLMDYRFVSHIEKMGWYDEFKRLSEEYITKILSDSLYPEIKGRIANKYSATPLTMEKVSGNFEGAITGWAFSNDKIPAVSKLTSLAKAIKTPLPHVYQAGQWTFSPSGFPISIITGKMAADKVIKNLKKK